MSLSKRKVFSEINVTPFVDVMLVLLVIFMVTAPLMLSGIKLNLPKTKEVNPMRLSSKQVVLSFTSSGEFYLGREKILEKELILSIKKHFKRDGVDTLYLRADHSLTYGRVARALSFLKRGGIQKISLVTETEKKHARRR